MSWFTLREIVDKTGIPYQSVARYIKVHSHHLQVKKEHKTYMIHEDSIQVLKKIRTCYSSRMTAREVDNELSASGVPIEHIVSENTPATMGEYLDSIESALKELNEKATRQEQFNQELLNGFKQQQEYIKELVKQRDDAVKEAEGMRQELALKEKKRWKFWS